MRWDGRLDEHCIHARVGPRTAAENESPVPREPARPVKWPNGAGKRFAPQHVLSVGQFRTKRAAAPHFREVLSHRPRIRTTVGANIRSGRFPNRG